MKTFLQTLFFFLLVTQICFAQGYWTKVGDMPEIRYAHTVDEINGKIYIVGGAHKENDPYPTTALIYDITTRNWTEFPLISTEYKVFHTSCAVDGKLYVIGGWTGNPDNFGKMEMFDPSTSLWTSKSPMPTPRGNLTCASMEGKIYVVGGMDRLGYTGLKTMEVYDIANDTWTQLADMPTGRWGPRAISFNGKIFVFGGTTGLATTVYASVEVFDPQTNTWTTKSNMPTNRYQLTTCLLDNRIFTIGGWLSSDTGPIYDKVEIYNPESDEWNTDSSLPVTRALLASIVLDDKIYVYGGSSTNHPLIGSSGIYELTFDDIFAKQPYIDKMYARKDLDSILFLTRFSNINNHQFIAHLIYANLDSIQIDSLNIFDDGLHEDSLANDDLYGVNIPSRATEDFYSLSVSTIDLQTNKYYNTPDRCRFTTAGPIKLDSIFYADGFGSSFNIKVFLLNLGSTKTITNASVKLICDDLWAFPISPNIKNLPNIPPGGIINNSSTFSVKYIDSLFPGYFNFKVEIMSDGWPYWTDSMQVIVTGVEDEVNKVPTEFTLEQNYPNPFNPRTKISWQSPVSSRQVLKIYDVLGNEIATLLNEEKEAGYHSIDFNAADMPSGVYFYQLNVGEFISTKKMILLR